jgi:hypothetical protein
MPMNRGIPNIETLWDRRDSRARHGNVTYFSMLASSGLEYTTCESPILEYLHCMLGM